MMELWENHLRKPPNELRDALGTILMLVLAALLVYFIRNEFEGFANVLIGAAASLALRIAWLFYRWNAPDDY